MPVNAKHKVQIHGQPYTMVAGRIDIAHEDNDLLIYAHSKSGMITKLFRLKPLCVQERARLPDGPKVIR
jgi:hypothetical protein